MTNKRFQKTFKSFDESLAKNELLIPGKLGIAIGGKKLVEVPNRAAFVYVQLHDNPSEVIQAFNDKVASSYGLPVLVVRRGNYYEVYGRDTKRYSDWQSSAPYLPHHAHTHELDIEGNGAGDAVFVYSRQFTPYMTYPSGTSGGPNLIISPHTLQTSSNTWKYIGTTGTPNLSPYNPMTGTQAVMVTIYLDSDTGNPGIVVGSGAYFPSYITGAAGILPYVPQITNPAYIPLTAVRLVTGTTAISWDNIYDLRQFLHPESTSAAATGGGITNIPVQDEGAPQGNALTFNFVGPNVDVSVSGTVARVFVTGTVGAQSSGGSGTVTIFDEGVLMGQVAELNFIGANVDASVSGSRARIFVTGSTGGGIPSGTVQVFNTGTFVGSATQFNFQYPLYVGFSGVMAYPSILGSPLAYEDVSAQLVTGAYTTHFNISGTVSPGTDRLYYNGLRQKTTTHYTVDVNGRGFTTLFTGTNGDVMLFEYGNLLTQQGGTTYNAVGGRYTPMATGILNVTSTSPNGTFMYTRVDNIVHVAGTLSIDPVSALSNTWVYLSLPIASNIGQTYDVVGIASYSEATQAPGQITGLITENMALIQCYPVNTANRVWSLDFTYEVI